MGKVEEGGELSFGEKMMISYSPWARHLPSRRISGQSLMVLSHWLSLASSLEV